MAALTIRNLDDDVKTKLRIRAAHNGRSMEAEVREILAEAVDKSDIHNHTSGVAEPRATYATAPSTEISGEENLTWETVDDETLQQIIHEGPEGEDLFDAFARVFGALGGVELDIPPRTEMPRPLDFGVPERAADGEQAISADAADLSNPGGLQSTGGRSKIMAMLAAMGIDEVPGELSPQQVEETRRLVYDDGPPNENVGLAFLRVFKSLGGVRLESPRSGREARWVDFSE